MCKTRGGEDQMKAKIMVAVARESVGFGNGEFTGSGKSEHIGTGKNGLKAQAGEKREPDRERRTPWVAGRTPWTDMTCYYCNEKGHTKKYCKKDKWTRLLQRNRTP